ncbi:hypothetical protein [Novosphingobium sp.]|uniref:hypothetical protein n=1 Tax=Novosphingobium sp. TaxID=1874826 RepID=UPI0038BC44F8
MAIKVFSHSEEISDNTILWRYMDIAKFCALLTQKALWFSSVEFLAESDPYEGRLPDANYAHNRWQSLSDLSAEEIIELENTNDYYNPGRNNPQNLEEKLEAVKFERNRRLARYHLNRRNTFVNCWHDQPHETVAMWQIYGSPGPGLAIRLSMSDLHFAFPPNSDVYAMRVKYLDSSAPPVEVMNIFQPMGIKRKEFQYEREIRLLKTRGNWGRDPIKIDRRSREGYEAHYIDIEPEPTERPEPGINVNVDLNHLLRDVVISPFAPDWVENLVNDLCWKFGIYNKVRRSNLLKKPPVFSTHSMDRIEV